MSYPSTKNVMKEKAFRQKGRREKILYSVFHNVDNKFHSIVMFQCRLSPTSVSPGWNATFPFASSFQFCFIGKWSVHHSKN